MGFWSGEEGVRSLLGRKSAKLASHQYCTIFAVCVGAPSLVLEITGHVIKKSCFKLSAALEKWLTIGFSFSCLVNSTADKK